MITRSPGASGPRVGAIGLGCMGMSDLYGPADEAESIATIHAALDAGVTLLDTGDFYGMGHNELLMREALRGRDRDRRRDQRQVRRAARPRRRLVVGDRRPAGRREELPRLHAAPPRHRLRRRLPPGAGRPGRADRGDRRRHRRDGEGRLRPPRRACRRPAPTRCAAPHAVHPIADLQIEYSLISRGIEAEILPTCRELGVGVTAYGVLSRGLLSGHWSKERATADRRLPRHQPALPGREPRPQPGAGRGAARDRRAPRARRSRRSPSPGCSSRGDDIVPLVGARRRDRLAEALGALDVELDRRRPGRIEQAVPAGAAAGDRYDAHADGAPRQRARSDRAQGDRRRAHTASASWKRPRTCCAATGRPRPPSSTSPARSA